jgi:hypothetical protein
MRTCNMCREAKAPDAFYRTKRTRCKACHRSWMLQYYRDYPLPKGLK